MTKPGDRIILIHMPNDPDPIPAGETGTVTDVVKGVFDQVQVDWDSGRTLCLIPGVDDWEVLL